MRNSSRRWRRKIDSISQPWRARQGIVAKYPLIEVAEQHTGSAGHRSGKTTGQRQQDQQRSQASAVTPFHRLRKGAAAAHEIG